MFTTKDFDYNLPPELIAQTPLANRSHSRMLVVDRERDTLEDRNFYQIIDYTKPGDALVINETRVLPARLYGIKPETGAHLEVLLLNNIEGNRWETLVKPAKRAKVGTRIQFGDDNQLSGEVVETLDHGGRIIEFEFDGIFLEVLETLGEMPLPPYIKEKLDDADRYQTVYAKNNGSAAAPTAGLHFTPELLHQLDEKGIEIIPLTLHVGLGTFRPVSVDDLSQHHMHSEYYQLTEESAQRLNDVRSRGGDIFAVGTTVVRTLETIAHQEGDIKASSGWTDIFIKPGFEYKVVDHLITNFHLPQSTLVMLVSAFYNRDAILKAYQHAVTEKYRFFSFGDAMLLL